nr:MAG TPA: hypothetical protein [Caudoviricetes sp.]
MTEVVQSYHATSTLRGEELLDRGEYPPRISNQN